MSEREYFVSKIQDLIRREERGEALVFSAFLTAEEAAEAAAICKNARAPHLLFGGYDESERKILAVSSLDQETLLSCFPIRLLSISDAGTLTNRDVLGALMASGIRRDVLGDIVVREGKAFVFVSEHIADFLIQNITSVGRQRVQLTALPLESEIPRPRFEEQRITAASLRVDAAVAGLCHLSREQASRLLELKQVTLNHQPPEKKTKEVTAGDCLTVRGFGKWIIDACGAQTKKGRVVLECRKYC